MPSGLNAVQKPTDAPQASGKAAQPDTVFHHISPTRRRHFTALGLLTVSLLVFWPPIKSLARLSFDDDRYTYILAIPLIAAVLAYLRKREIFFAASYWPTGGCALITAGLLLGSAAALMPDALGRSIAPSVAALGLVFVWAGIFALCYGRMASNRARFALLFLALTIPLPSCVMDMASVGLQHSSAATSCALFKMLGVPVLAQGVMLSLPGVNIEVAKECSGIRSSISLLLTSALTGYAFLRSGYSRMFLVVATIPIAILKNAVRIVIIAWLGLHVSSSVFYGSLHRKGGALFALPALALMLSLAYALRRWEFSYAQRSVWRRFAQLL